MTGPAVSVAFASPACAAEAATLFAGAAVVTLERDEMRPARPFQGRLFATLAALPSAACVGLLVPMRLTSTARAGDPRRSLVVVEDHVNLELCGPLTGVWPAAAPRTFPSMTARYQPAVVRSAADPRVYSGGVVAGVGDLLRLTPFERRSLRRAGCRAAADLLVHPAVVAAYYGHTLAACGVVQAPPIDEE